MSLDINRLLDQMDDDRDATLNLIDKFKKISDLAKDFDGTIAETVPLQIKKDIEIITDLTDGQGQNSISSLISLIENVPVGQVRTRRAVRTTLDPQAATQNVNAAPAIDTTPDTSGGVQSAVAAEAAGNPAPVVESTKSSSALSEYLKEGKKKEMQARYIANTINLGQVLEGTHEDSPYGNSMNEMMSPDLHYNLNKILEGAGEGVQEISNAFDTSLKSNMAQMRESVARLHENDSAEPTPDWRKAAQSVHMNESLNGFDGMFGGARRRNNDVSGMSFRDMFKGGMVDPLQSVNVVDNEWNDGSYHK
jgi:hypothetical protein